MIRKFQAISSLIFFVSLYFLKKNKTAQTTVKDGSVRFFLLTQIRAKRSKAYSSEDIKMNQVLFEDRLSQIMIHFPLTRRIL